MALSDKARTERINKHREDADQTNDAMALIFNERGIHYILILVDPETGWTNVASNGDARRNVTVLEDALGATRANLGKPVRQ